MVQNNIQLILFLIFFYAAIAVWTDFFTKRIRQYLIRHNIHDIPDKRSSHSIPTPRGGGIAIVLTVLIGLCLLLLSPIEQKLWILIIVIAGIIIALVGWFDDIKSLTPKTKLLCQFIIALIPLWCLGTDFTIDFASLFVLKGFLLYVFVVLYIVWTINFYNFMDGIDGIAASQCASISVICGIWAYVQSNIPLSFSYLILSATCIGFLRKNWFPAKIFMGDAGSLFLGSSLAILSLWGEKSNAIPFIAFLILMAVFIGDSTYTVIRRLFVGKKIYVAHCNHAYQHAVKLGMSHAKVTLIIICLNFFWLLPMALMSSSFPNISIIFIVVAYLPLIILAIYLKAGVELSDKH